jgi:endo-1,4-beta-xylanase
MKTHTKHAPIVIVAGSVLLALASATAQTGEKSLRSAVGNSGLLIGTAIDPALLTEPGYAETAAKQFNMVEAENSMKWAAVHPTEEKFNFESADKLVSFASARGMKVRGHVLVWNPYTPEWVTAKKSTQLSGVLHNHIKKVVEHFKGQVFAWDVVNEAFTDNGEIKQSVWYDAPGIGLNGQGTAYIEQSFRWAREADPTAKLFYNDYGAEQMNAKSDAIYNMVKDFKKRGVPIDGVGFQMHIRLNGTNFKSVAENFARFTALGVEVQITELDVAIANSNVSGNERQAKIYSQAVAVCTQNPGCTAIQTWGFTDKHSWVPQFSNGTEGAALPFDSAYQPKPAYFAMVKALSVKP